MPTLNMQWPSAHALLRVGKGRQRQTLRDDATDLFISSSKVHCGGMCSISAYTITFSDVRTKCPDVLKMVRQSQNLVRHHVIVFSAYAWNGA